MVAADHARKLGIQRDQVVQEWGWDWYGAYPAAAGTDPIGPRSGQNRVIRGGSWHDVDVYARVAFRYYNAPDYRAGILGFRVARSLP